LNSDGRVALIAASGQRLHPATVIWVWSILLLAVLSLQWGELYIAVLAAVIVAFFFARATLLRMLRRSRWLFLSIALLFGWMTPGMPVLGIPGLTDAGLSQAILHGARLVFVLAWVALLLDRLEFLLLLSGFRSLLQALQLVGININQGVVRLALTMEKIKSSEPWRFDQMDQVPEAQTEQGVMSTLRLVVPDFGWIDRGLMAVSSLLFFLWMQGTVS
jgi:hypothetical protein